MDLPRLVAEAILADAADAVVATDHNGIIRVWNPRVSGSSAIVAARRAASRWISLFPSSCVRAIGKAFAIS